VSAIDDDRLLDVAATISYGDAVDWSAVDTADREPATSRVLRELQVVERIAAFHRTGNAIGMWGHLTLLEKIDEGAYGCVYRAHDPKLQADVALKLLNLPEDRAADASRALKEARLLAKVRHPNVVCVHGVDVFDGRAGIWMEFVEGQTLAALLKLRGPLGPREAALIGLDLCQALAAVHRAHLIHGDVKARNVMREAGGRTVLMDFGTGKDLAVQPAPAARGIDLAGTPLYIAPEVFRGAPRSTLTDIYSLGVLLFHLVTGEYPAAGRTQADIEESHASGTRKRLRDLRPDAPAAFVQAVERAVAPDPRDRFQTAGELEAALTRFVADTNEKPSPVWPAWVMGIAALVLAVGVAVGAYWWTHRNTDASAAAPTLTSQGAIETTAHAASSYRIDSALYMQRNGDVAKLRQGDRVAPGDQLFARVRVSAPTYVYIVNEDDSGESFLLFPLPGQAVDNPLPAGTIARIPGTRREELTWRITSAGGREHFLIFASSERLQAFEDLFAALPRPTFDKPITSSPLSAQTVAKLRGVGGLATVQPTGSTAKLAGIFTSPLGDGEQTAQGLWVRQLTVENPPK